MEQQPVWIDDLPSPRFPPKGQSTHLTLTSGSLHAAATTQTGTDHFGPGNDRERFDACTARFLS